MAEEKSISRESFLFGVIGLLLGIVIAILFTRNAVNNDMQGMMRMMGIRTSAMSAERQDMMGHEGSSMTMDQMSETLQGKTGDNFDKVFIEGMIVHHQGAIDMANLAKQNAKHQEIKDLADDIISAQTSEIKMMRDWQNTWGY